MFRLFTKQIFNFAVLTMSAAHVSKLAVSKSFFRTNRCVSVLASDFNRKSNILFSQSSQRRFARTPVLISSPNKRELITCISFSFYAQRAFKKRKQLTVLSLLKSFKALLTVIRFSVSNFAGIIYILISNLQE